MSAPAIDVITYRHRHGVRVGYVDTDRGNVVHHSTYLRYLEAARVEWLRARGVVYKALELDEAYGLPVVEANVKYRRPAHFDDELVIETWAGKLTRATLRFDYAIWRDGEKLADAEIVLACVKIPSGMPRSIPETIKNAVALPR
jgi:acyl-CoA thioester hydrolase